MPFGLTADGFVPRTVNDIRDAMTASFRASQGTSLDLSDEDPLGQAFGIVSSEIAEAWEVLEDIYAARSRDSAAAEALDTIGFLTGLERPAARSSRVTLYLTGTNTTVIAAGSRASTTSTGKAFATTEGATLATATSWATGTTYAVGDVRTNATRIYYCITAGLSASAPTTTADDITDGTVHWRYVGEGAAYDTAAAESVDTGPIVALSGDITTITTPVGGWSSVKNLLDADLGADEASDEEYRLLQEIDLAAAGASTADAIRQAVLEVEDVTSVTVFVNDLDTTDGDGMPPHSVEVMVQGGADQDIFDTVGANAAGGIKTHGTEAGTWTDSEGNEHDVEFSRPDEVEIYVDVVLIKDPDEYPADGDAQVKAAIVAYGDAQLCGKDVVASRISAAVFGIAGVLDVTDIDIGTAPSPTLGTTITITSRQLATFDTSRITVATSDGSP